MCGSAVRISRNGASSITLRISAKRSGGNSSSGETCCSPALLTTMSAATTGPSDAHSSSTAAVFPRSATYAVPPISLATRSAESSRRSTTTAPPPAAASRWAQAAPMPLPAPVTTARRPDRSGAAPDDGASEVIVALLRERALEGAVWEPGALAGRAPAHRSTTRPATRSPADVGPAPSAGLGTHRREEDHLAHRLAGEQHEQPVDADAGATHRRGAVLQRAQEVLVELHGLGVAAGGEQGLL